MKAPRKKRRSRLVPRAIFATLCIGVVPELGSCCFASVATTAFSVAAECFTDAGKPGPCGEDFPPGDAGMRDAGLPDAGLPDAGPPDAGHGDGG